ncbi:hypothetical protein ACFXJ5_09615 [Streptomyces sp. NPDC059373]
MVELLPLLTAVLGSVATAVLARSALRHWWAERAGRPYELPVAYAGTVLRATGAAVAAGVAAGAICWGPGVGSGVGSGVSLGGGSGGASGGARPAHIVAGPAPARDPAPPVRPRRNAAPDPDPGPPRTVAHPAGGALQRFADGTRVWLPPQYDYPSAAGLDFPYVVAYMAQDDAPGLLGAFDAHVRRGLADPFVVVLPARCGARVPDAVTDRYRLAPVRSARALLGLGDQAPCAVREALTHPDRYQAAAGVSGTYDDMALPRRSTTDFLLATPSGEEAHADAALRLRDEMGDLTEVRILDGITPRRRLLGLVAGYFTEKLDGPESPIRGWRRTVPPHQGGYAPKHPTGGTEAP